MPPNPHRVAYADARANIKTGDLIAMRTRDWWFSRLVSLVTISPYTHVGIAIWLEGGLYIAEMNGGGNVLTPLSQKRQPFDVFRAPTGDESTLRQALGDALRTRIPYAFTDLIRVGMRLWLRRRFQRDGGDMICSAFVTSVYERAGWTPPPHNWPPTPADVVALIGYRPDLEVTP